MDDIKKATNVIYHNYNVTRNDIMERQGHRSVALFMTGLSGSGKSTIANALNNKLFEMGVRSFVLDGDNIRYGLNKNLGFSIEDRNENIRRIAEVSKLMVESGTVVISAFIAPTIDIRQLAKDIIGGDFVEIFVDCDLSVCEARDPKGLYKKARSGDIKNFTGIDSVFEAPENPDIHIKTHELGVDDAVKKIIGLLEYNNKI